MRLSVVVPCYNEEDVIDTFDARVRSTLNGLGIEHELCYIDDGSSDATLEHLRSLAAQNEDTTRYFSLPFNP